MTDSRTLGRLKLALLGLIAQRPCSGYDLLKVFRDTAMGGFSHSPGAVYPALKWLETNGLIRGKLDNHASLRPRQVYHLTAAGTAAIKKEVRLPVTRDDVMRNADGVLLRFVFAGQVLGRDEAVRILDEYAGQIESYLPDLKAQLASLSDRKDPYGRLALQHGIDMYRTDAKWARKTIKQLNTQSPVTWEA